MGGGRWDPGDWKDYTASQNYASKSTAQIYSARGMDPSLSPHGIKGRESCDSPDNPNSNAIIVALDVTGSMHTVLDAIARKGLNTLLTEIYNRKPVSDPHVMCMGIGDVAAGDSAPLQITQFEADIRIAQQLEKLYLEGGGGGNGSESYMLAWYFAAHHTTIDCFEKRQKKGYLFTIGDDGPTPRLTRDEIQTVMGYRPEADVDRDQLLTLVSRKWEVFHLTIAQGDTASPHVRQQWLELLGENAIWLEDHTRLAEVVVSIIQMREGTDQQAVVDSWDGSTAVVVQRATAGLAKRAAAAGGIVRL